MITVFYIYRSAEFRCGNLDVAAGNIKFSSKIAKKAKQAKSIFEFS